MLGRERELAGRQLAALVELDQSSNCAWLISATGEVRVTPAHPADRSNSWRNARAERGQLGRGVLPRRARRLRRASASAVRSWPSLDACLDRALVAQQPLRLRVLATASVSPGRSARAASGTAAARAARCRTPTSRCARTRRELGGRVGIGRARWSTTARIATPTALPRRITTLICGVASESCSGRIAAKAAVIAGMNAEPDADPAHEQHGEIVTIRGVLVDQASGIVLIASIETPTIATRPPPWRSVRRPAIGIVISAPIPCGPLSRPVSITLR